MTSLANTRVSSKSSTDDDALIRGSRVQPNSNDGPVILAFVARGIAPHDIETFGPSQNVRTYRAWRALGRQVRKGEKSVRCTVWLHSVKTDPKTGKDKDCSFPKTACVFHVSQTDEIGGAS